MRNTRYGGRPRSLVEKNGTIFPTVAQLPTRPSNEYTHKARRRAIDEANSTGRLERATDLWRASLTEFGASNGIVYTIVHGILGLDLKLHGDPLQISTLLDCDGTAGDFSRMFPEEHAAQVFLDGIGLGVGLGQRVYEPNREIGDRSVPKLIWWDTRNLRQDPWSKKWYVRTRSGEGQTDGDGEVEIRKDDPEWLIFLPYGDDAPWKTAPWVWSSLALVLARDSIFDCARHSEVCSPVRVMKGTAAVTKQQLSKAESVLRKMARDNWMALGPNQDFKFVESTGKIADIYFKMYEFAERQWVIGWTGQTVTTDGGKAFSSTSIHDRIARDKLRFYAKVWFTCVREQGLSHWAWENFGSCHPPTGGYNVDPPEDVTAKGTARVQWSAGIQGLVAVGEKIGYPLDPKWVVEDAQKQGIRYTMPSLPDVEDEGAENDLPTPGYAERLAAKLTELQADKCRHTNPNSCVHCGIRREDEPIQTPDGIAWQIKWVPRIPSSNDNGTSSNASAVAMMRAHRVGMRVVTARKTRAMAARQTPFFGFGFPVVVEVPDGGTRSGTSTDGTDWSVELRGTAYGFVPNTSAADGEELDVLVGESVAAKMAFIIDQGDECKLAIGFDSAQEARAAYTNNWPPSMLKGFYAVPMSVITAMLAQEAA